MKATYNNSQEIAELYIKSGLKDKIDIKAFINESAKQLSEKVGREDAIKICMPFMQNTEVLFTIEGLVNYINAVGIESISFIDPITGKIENTVYIHLKN